MKIFALLATVLGGAFLGARKAALKPVSGDPVNVYAEPAAIAQDAPGDVSLTYPEITPDAVLEAPKFIPSIVEAVSGFANDTGVRLFGTPYDDLIYASAMTAGIKPDTLYKLLYAESHFRPDIISGKVRSGTGALGIAQFMPATAIQELGSVNAALDPARAIPGAARYLAKLIRITGSEKAGIAAYNWGVGNVQRKGLSKAPAETVNYVYNIIGVDILKA